MSVVSPEVPAVETLVDAIAHWAGKRGEEIALDFRARTGAEPVTLTYAQLSASARALAARLAREGHRGDRVLILLPSGIDYVVALLGCMQAGFIGVPVNLPGPSRVRRVLGKVGPIAADCKPRFIVTTDEIRRQSQADLDAFAQQAGARVLILDAPCERCAWQGDPLRGTDTAFLQYTSGSTGEPKGVINGHAPLMRNLRFISRLLAPKERPVVVSWLPLYHDMGLIMGVFAPLVAGGKAVVLSPTSFVADPLHWLEVASAEGAGMMPCPAFSMDACVERYDAARCAALDLSRLESFIPAAEPVLPRQVAAFQQTFAPHGLRPEAIRPAYGLAEATLLVTTGFAPAGPRHLSIEAAALEEGRAVPVEAGAAGARTYVSNGAETDGQDVRIVDPETLQTLPEGRVGEIWVGGDEIAWGYWGNEAATAATFRAVPADGSGEAARGGPFLRTGDLGFLQDGHLYVTGRLKDMMILRGQCHYPNDLEASLVGAHPAIVGGAAAAFAIDDAQGREAVVLVQEVRRDGSLDAGEVESAIREVIAREHGLALADVVLIRKGTLKRTTSGKVRRAEMRRAYLAGDLVLAVAPVAEEPASRLAPAADGYRALVAEIAAAALGLGSARRIDPQASLFALGFDSLAATQAIAALEGRLGRQLPEGLLFDHPTVASLADWLTRSEQASGEAAETAAPSRADARAASGSAPRAEPLAIIGLSCLFPGGDEDFDDPARFWSFLMQGGDAVRPLSPARFAPEPEIPGFGACLTRVDGFDAAFFGMGAREAINTDPQQRLLMEAAWHALEDAGIPPSRLAGTDTGVFIGIGTGDYGHIPFATGDRSHLDPYYGTGTAFAAAAGRLSFFFDWHGPSLAVDTACSASHAAVHNACQALRLGECGVALAGGVKLQMLTEIDLVLARAGMLAADGRCKTFDASADGYVRGEGLGMVVLKRLSDALRDGDPIRAVVLESVLAQDGASAGLSAPNAAAQRRMIDTALRRAGLTPGDIDYLELHGTGTRLGDPIEYRAVRDVFAGRPKDDPLYLGSVKTNIGHLEAGAGIAGLIKAVLAVEAGQVPPHLHLNEVNPEIGLGEIPAVVPDRATDWPRRGSLRRAGVTSFGFAGTIGHILLEQAPEQAPEQAAGQAADGPPPPLLLAFSARSREAADSLCRAFAERLSQPGTDARALVNAAAHHRDHEAGHRVAVAAGDAAGLVAELERAVCEDRPAKPARIAFLFTGQGAQYPAMCRGLYDAEPVFREAFDRADAALLPHLGRSIRDLVFNAGEEELRRTEFAQPALFAVQFALARLWRAFGVEPAAVIGHSIGEFAAFVHAGMLELDDAARVIARRGRLMQELPEAGAMLAVRLPQDEAEALADQHGLSLAAVNSSADAVLAGSEDKVERLAALLERQGVSARRLHVSHAFHSALMEPMLAPFAEVTADIALTEPRLAVFSTVTGAQLRQAPGADYWGNQARRTVRYAEALGRAFEAGCDTFVEIGPRPVLTMLSQREAQHRDLTGALFLASAAPDDAGGLMLRRSLAALYRRGVDANRAAVFRGERARPSQLPLYPFVHTSYWLDYGASQPARAALPAPGRDSSGVLPLYRVEWDEVELPPVAPASASVPATPLITVGGSPDLVRALREAAPGREIAACGSDEQFIGNPEQPIVWLDGFEAEGEDAAPNVSVLWRLIRLSQKLQSRSQKFRILLPTRGAQGENGTDAPFQAAFWGAARSLSIECPDLQILLVDIAPDCDPAGIFTELLPRLEAVFEEQDMLQARADGWFSPRITALEAPAPQEAASLPVDGAYLVCGGAGATGAHVVEWLAAKGVRHIVVTARSAPGPRARAAHERLRLAGVDIRHVEADVADEAAMAAVLAGIDGENVPLRGVFHCAGIGLFDTLEELGEENFSAVLRSKLQGSAVLHRLTEHRTDLAAFVLFSSISGVWGSRLQIHYGAANAYQDALVRSRRARGLPGLSIAWGPWGGKGGLSDLEDNLLDLLRRARIHKFEPARGIATLDRLVTGPGGTVVAVDVEWPAFAPLYRAFGRSDLLARVAPALAGPVEGERPDWSRLSEDERRQTVGAFVDAALREVLKVDAGVLSDEADLIGLGLDSILVMDLARVIARDLGLACPLRAIFENATPGRLRAHLVALAGEAEPSERSGDISAGSGGQGLILADANARHEPFPLTELQYAYWVGRDPRHVLGGIACHAYLETEPDTPFDIARLEEAWNLLIARHDALRLVVDDTGRQRILAEVPRYRIDVTDLSEADADRIAYHLLEMRDTLSHQVLDPSVWPMFDIRLTRMPGGRDRLHISIDMLINDAMSSQILWQEWQAIYLSGSAEAAGLPPFTISFRDYVLAKSAPDAERQRRFETDRTYWLAQLDELPQGPQLPLARAPEHIGAPRFSRLQAGLDAARWEALKAQARKVGVTPAGLLVGVFGEVLAAWSDQARFSLNLTIFDRLALHEDVPRLVGDFTCLTLLALDFEAAMPLGERLRDVQGRMFEALEHRTFSAVDVLRELNRGEAGRQFAAPVVFTSQLGMQDPTKGTSEGDVLGRLVHGITQTPQVWLDHQAGEQDGALVYNWDVVDGLFPAGLVEGMFTAYGALLERLADEAKTWHEPVGDLRPESQRKVRRAVNETARELPLDLLDAPFFRKAQAMPQALALVAGGRSYSYGELAGWVRRLAGGLRQAGIRRGERVAVLMEKGAEQAAACLAILSQGGVYVPVDPAIPSQRFASIVETSGIRLGLTQARLTERLPEFSGKLVLADEEACDGYEEAGPASGRALSDEAYVIYTSGSTGTPKGVLIDHRGASNTVLDINARFDVDENDRIFGFSALGFDLSVYDLFGSFAAGAALVLPDPEGTHDPSHWAELIARLRATVWNSVPAVCDLLLGETEADLSSLRLVLLSGDWVPLKLPAILRERVPGARLIAMGGATEASIWSNWFEVEEVQPGWTSIPYGTPLSNQSYRVLDARLRDRPDWVIGDLHIGGVGLALGYEGDKERTEAAFVRHPDGERLYRTGDMARYWPDGIIEFLGRRDTQVKIAGHRIELGDIEAALAGHAGIRDAVVDVVGSQERGRRLVAWLRLEGSHPDFHETLAADPAEAAAIAASLGDTLAGGMQAIALPQGRADAYAAWQAGLAARTLADLFAEAGLPVEGDKTFDPQDAVAALGLVSDFRPQLPRWLAHLERQGVLRRAGDRFRFGALPSSWEEMEDGAREAGQARDLVVRLKGLVPEIAVVLRGEMDPLELFYADGADLSPERLARLHPCAVDAHRRIGEALAEMAKAAGRPLRVLELGARGGVATRDWLSGLTEAAAGEPARTLIDLVLADPSPLLLAEATRDLPGGVNAATVVLDPEGTLPAELDPNSFDVVLAFNALHRARDVGDLLANARSLLKPAGHLLAVELTVNGPMIDLTAGLIERGFAGLADQRKESGLPLMAAPAWMQSLGSAGFDAAMALDPADNGDLAVLVARNVDPAVRFRSERVIRHLERVLPAYMVPRQVVPLAALPLSANGKVDRKRLPMPGEAAPEQQAMAAPRSESERRLAAIWSELLGHEVGRDANFFAAGGDSLIAVRMTERIRAVFGRKVKLRSIFAMQDLAELAAHLDDLGREGQEASGEAPVQLSVDPHAQFEPFPLTDVQQAYFIGRQPLFPLGGVSTHIFAEIDVTDLSAEALGWAWNRLVQRHGMLRAVIDEEGNQRILPQVPVFSAMTADLTEGDEAALEHWLERQRREMSHRVYDTAQWPLFDVRMAKHAGGVRLLVSLDNLVCDGRSMVMILSEWAALARDRETVLPPLDLSFRDVVLHWESEEASPAHAASLEHWFARLPDLPPAPNLPLRRKPEDLTPPRFARLAGTLSHAEWAAFRAHAAAAGLSPNAALLSAYAASLRGGGGGDRFSLNLTLFRRDPIHPQIDLLVGDFTSLLLVPFEAREGEGFAAAARRLQDRLMEDLEHARVSAVRVMREAARRGTDAQALAVPVVFTSGVGVDNTASDGRTADWLGRFTGGITQTPQVWIDHQVVDRDGELAFNWDHVEGLFDGEWIEGVFNAYCRMLSDLAADANAWQALLAAVEPAAAGALPDTDGVETSEDAEADETRSGPVDGAIAELIADLLAQELGTGPVDRSASFFELGATSLTLLRLHQKLRKALGRNFPVVAMFAHPSVQALAGHLGAPEPVLAGEAGHAGTRRAAGRANAERRRRVREL
ncbi:non-ribosomal peptide synthetase/type I polyketide synthase [Stappia indica]|uniref:Amino acid adenylation domain-containing protein n=1 Tax=Stappia indica TaxID=538381 RepID=A0A857CDD7_9HYPH|nr:non-ribosomal peptide synthetase/type I polyketide synthase [Stappia indica]QGZ37044.1 amino acid adenylation domain-containing protein [Stappia indica]